MNKAFNDNRGKTSDDYNTSKSAFALLKEFVPEDQILYDPFFNDGTSKKYMEEVFKCTVIHENRDAFEWMPECDLIITNPPFSKKYKVLDWLIKQEKPFFCLLPLYTIATKKFGDIDGFDKLQFIVGNGRIKYEKGDDKIGCASFESAWFCHKIDLPRDITFVI